MRKWLVISLHDGNDSFVVEGEDYGIAACEALKELGYSLSVGDDDEDIITKGDKTE
jgi:hypothetical protein